MVGAPSGPGQPRPRPSATARPPPPPPATTTIRLRAWLVPLVGLAYIYIYLLLNAIACMHGWRPFRAWPGVCMVGAPLIAGLAFLRTSIFAGWHTLATLFLASFLGFQAALQLMSKGRPPRPT